MKKLISFLFCMAPAATWAVDATPFYFNDNCTGTDCNGYTATSSSPVDVSEMKIGGSLANPIDNGFYVGGAGLSPNYTLYSNYDVTIGGQLSIAAGQGLIITTETVQAAPINVEIGSVLANGTFGLSNISALTLNGALVAKAGLAIDAESIGGTDSSITAQGNADINVANSFKTGNIINNGGAAGEKLIINAGTLDVNNIQNVMLTGVEQPQLVTNITVTGADAGAGQYAMNVAGNIDNLAATGVMDITANNGTVFVGGTVNNAGDMEISAKNLRITGGASSGTTITTPSFVSSGNLTINVTGDTYLGYGFNLAGMENKKFSLTTGTLAFETQSAWGVLLNNAINDFTLNIKNGDILQETVRLINSGDSMSVSANNIKLASVENIGDKLSITANGDGSATGGITIGTAIVADTGDHPIKTVISGATGTTTDVISDGSLVVWGLTNNAGTMTLNGRTTVEMSDIYNTGSLKVLASTGVNGKITIGMSSDIENGNITNSGDLTINARQIQVNGVLKNLDGGHTVIKGSDAVDATDGLLTIAGLDVAGGTVDISAVKDGVNIGKSLSVSGGVLNMGANVGRVNVGDATHAGMIDITGDLVARGADTSTAENGNMYVDAAGGFFMRANGTDSVMDIKGSVMTALDAFGARMGLYADSIKIGGSVAADNNGTIAFYGDNFTAGGAVSAMAGSAVEIHAATARAESLAGAGKFVATGGANTPASITTTGENGINIAGGVWFDGNSAHNAGMVIYDTAHMTLTAENGDISFAGGGSLGNGNTLVLNSTQGAVSLGDMTMLGALNISAKDAATLGALTNKASGVMNIAAATVSMAGDISNDGIGTINSAGTMNLTSLENNGTLSLIAAGDITATGQIKVDDGTLNITAADNKLVANGGVSVADGAVANINVDTIDTGAADIAVAGNIIHGTPAAGQDATNGALLLADNDVRVSGGNLTVGGLYVNSGAATYDMTGAVTMAGQLAIASGATADLSAGAVNVTGVIESKGGTLVLTSRDAVAVAGGLVISDGGSVTLAGRGLDVESATLDASALYQNHSSAPINGINVKTVGSSEYLLGAGSMTFGEINQMAGKMALDVQNLTVNGDINAQSLRVYADATSALDVNVTGDVSGGVQFINLGGMDVGGNYFFDDNSEIFAQVSTASDKNYWSTVSLVDDNTLGQITNADGGSAMINVGEQFSSNLSLNPSRPDQFGVGLYELVDQGKAIWLLHADGGIVESGNKLRNLSIVVCNQSGTRCYDYFDASKYTEDTMPAYLTVRDTDGDGIADDLYVVFDPRFGGPVEVFQIQPIVGRQTPHTAGEWMSAGALDNMVVGGLADAGFVGRHAIEAIPAAFSGTNLQAVADELYDRMEQYNQDRDGTGLARFSRLFQPREIEQIAGAVALGEHVSFRDFEDRMFDEFIWNRNRRLKKAWGDVTFGTFTQNTDDAKTVDGNRFSVSGGFDWQESETLILGLTGRVSHMSSDTSDVMNLGYGKYDFIAGQMSADVADTNIALGGYLMKTLGDKTLVYGNAFLDLHLFDVSRDQTYVSSIDGRGTAFSLITEWGFMHDWLNQYIVGNAYARAGYNFGFSVTERVGGDDYMNLESDGYLVFTPGYSLTAQKRIYPSSWLQIRPYVSVGIEYDVLGAPRDVQYKFAVANDWTDYEIDIDPMWANVGGGFEILSARGFQFGVDYRYQYNADISLHNIKLSGSYRF